MRTNDESNKIFCGNSFLCVGIELEPPTLEKAMTRFVLTLRSVTRSSENKEKMNNLHVSISLARGYTN